MFKKDAVINRYKNILAIIYDTQMKPLDYVRFVMGFSINPSKYNYADITNKERFINKTSEELFIDYLNTYTTLRELSGISVENTLKYSIILARHQGHLRGLFGDDIYKLDDESYRDFLLRYNISHMKKEVIEVEAELEQAFNTNQTTSLALELSDVLIITLVSFSTINCNILAMVEIVKDKTLYNVETRKIKEKEEK